jgi:basic membrane lipoprotein Med (substrate-binding protein (PBP1-ABC) superfamily)
MGLLALLLAMGFGQALAAEPDKVKIAVILTGGVESSWQSGLVEALERVRDKAPHGLEVSWTLSDPIFDDDAAEAMRIYADSGEYQIIWCHGPYSDQVAKVKDEFPDIAFAVVGSGNQPLGGNQYWIYKRVHEASYLSGMIAGGLTKSGAVGAVGTFPGDDVNDEINAFFAGAREMRSDASQRVAFVESWYDPGKAAEYTNAMVATGVDNVLQLTGNFEACKSNNIFCFGSKADENHFAPDNIVTSAVALWDPDLDWIIGEWWNHATTAAPYDGNAEPRWFSMAEGGVSLAPFHALEGKVPDELRAKVAKTEAEIRDGSFKVPLDTTLPVSK